MADLTAQRTLVKSPPELWSELSEVESLARHLGELGEIRITKVEPESTVAWEGEEVSGTVELEESGWGTKVTLTATVPEPAPAAEPEPEPVVAESEPVAVEVPAASVPVEPEPVAVAAEPEAQPERRGFFARWFFRERSPAAVPAKPEPVAAEPEPEPIVEPEPEPVLADPEPVAVEPEPTPTSAATDRVQQVLDGTLDALGQAHHRPFSRG
jgi:hypothetical protein